MSAVTEQQRRGERRGEDQERGLALRDVDLGVVEVLSVELKGILAGELEVPDRGLSGERIRMRLGCHQSSGEERCAGCGETSSCPA
jgi:hypothetical protein